MASKSRVMEKTIQQQPQPPPPPPHEALKCPRCDSSNTKFCYYNNYSLSQPRHFCKACKRYWTRGGTLRNVPVGGGCRKNKRVKRPPITATPSSNNNNATPATSHHNHQPHQVNHHHTNPNPNHNDDRINQIPSSTTSNTTNSNHHLNPLFYGLIPHQNPNYPRIFDTTTTTNHLVSGGYGTVIQPHHMINNNASESLSYSPLGTASGGSSLNFGGYSNNNNNSFMYGGGGGSTTPSTMASLLASTLNQQQRIMGGNFANYDHDGMMSTSSNNLVIKDLKLENISQNKMIMDWDNDNNFHGGQNKSDHGHDDQIVVVSSSDPNSMLWDAEGGGGGWLDQTNHNNIGSTSVPSLI